MGMLELVAAFHALSIEAVNLTHAAVQGPFMDTLMVAVFPRALDEK